MRCRDAKTLEEMAALPLFAIGGVGRAARALRVIPELPIDRINCSTRKGDSPTCSPSIMQVPRVDKSSLQAGVQSSSLRQAETTDYSHVTGSGERVALYVRRQCAHCQRCASIRSRAIQAGGRGLALAYIYKAVEEGLGPRC